MDFKDLRYIRIPNGDGYRDCYKITDAETGKVIWWSPVTVSYYYTTNHTAYISSETILYGQDATPPEMPSSIGDYYANSWNTTFDNIKRDLTAIFTYDHKFTVTFKDDVDYAVIESRLLPAGSAISKDEYPEAGFREYYTFDSWDPEEIDQLNSDTTVLAKYLENAVVVDRIDDLYQYDEKDHQFIVNAHITNNITPKIEYSITGNDGSWSTVPVRASEQNTNMQVLYRVTGYNTPTLTGVGTLRILPAQIFSVTFVYKRNDGTEARYKTRAEYGGSATAPGIPDLDAYLFDGWDKTFDKVYTDLVVTAKYNRRPVFCNVYSSLSNSCEETSCFYGDKLQPIAVCD